MEPPVISLIALPGANAEALPVLLLQQGELWSELPPWLDPRAGVLASTVRARASTLLTEILRQLRGGQTVSRVRFRADLQELYEALVPDVLHQALQNALAASAAPTEAGAAPNPAPLLRIYQHPAVEWVPWELLNDETDFLGLRFCIARLPILTRLRRQLPAGPRDVRRVAHLLGRAVFDPPQERRLLPLWQQTFADCLPPATRLLRFPANPNGESSAYPTLDALEQATRECDIIHITCHGGLNDAEGQPFWTLDHQSSQTFDYRITASVVDNLPLSRSPLVFGNACASSGGALSDNLGLGFGTRFFARGALAFIGSLAPITQEMGVRFAQRFYSYLLRPDGQPGLPLGWALLQTKRSFAEAGDPDPSYLYYCLYGPAEATFYASTAEEGVWREANAPIVS